METNIAVMKAVTGMPYNELVAMIHRHYPTMFDVISWETECALQGLGVRNNLVLYLTVVNTLGVKDQFIHDLTGRGRGEPGVDTGSSAAAGEECDLESDPSYTIGFTCNTTRGCVFDIERELLGDTECYEYIGNNDNEDDAALAVDVTTQGAAQDATTQKHADVSGLSAVRDTLTVSAKENEYLSGNVTEPSEKIAETLMDKCVLDGDTDDNQRKVVMDDD